MRRITGMALVAFIGLLGALAASEAQAQTADRGPVVVELFTSQGCSSCPPADAVLRDLALRPDVVALALHVDYWDYIGWKDVFADPRFTARQFAYARAMGRRAPYTPQMVVGGAQDVVGSHRRDVADLIATHAARPQPVTLQADRAGGTVTIRATSRQVFAPPLQVQLVRYRDAATVTVKRGELAGQTLDYAHIVTDWRVVGQWDGRLPLAMTQTAPGSDPVVVILQRPGPGAIEAAAQLR